MGFTRPGRVALLCLCVVSSHALASKEQAAAILRESGVQGGLVLHVGCGDGALTASLRVSPAFLVHGLDRDQAKVDRARQAIRALGLYGQVTADLRTGSDLPLVDNVVRLLVDETAGGDAAGTELMRVLTPGGVALVRHAPTGLPVAGTVTILGETWSKLVKPVPSEIDEWTHYLHGPSNNAVSHDQTVSYPHHMQWAGYPMWTRNHNHTNSYSAVVSAEGRVFYILDEGPTQSVRYAPKWRLAARDAFSGVVLWKKDIEKWEGHLRPFRSGPAELPRRLVAAGDRLFVTLNYGAPLSVLSAATGALIRDVAGTDGTHEILYSDGVLYLVAGSMDEEKYRAALAVGQASPAVRGKRIMAVAADSGRTLWSKADADTAEMPPSTLCVSGTRLFFHGLSELICLDSGTGRVLWRTPRPLLTERKAWSAPTLVAYGDVLLSAEGSFGDDRGKRRGKPAEPAASDTGQIRWQVTASPKSAEGGELIAFRADDGAELWRCPAAFGYCAPPNLFVADGLVWVSKQPGINDADMTEGRDPLTGAVKRRIDTTRAFEAAHHHRCYRDKATNRFFLFGRTGVEYVDILNGDIQRHFWIRGTCQYGIMPANGLLYLPGHSCGCYIQSKLNGFWALAPKRRTGRPQPGNADRLLRGPAWNAVPDQPEAGASAWPIHRYDNGRTSCTPTTVPAELAPVWRTGLGAAITPPVIAAGKVVVALKDKHVVTALDATDGRQLWSFSAGGRIDSPPTLSRGVAVFGAHDGHVYCLRLADGRMVWRFRAAPVDRRTYAFGQLESVWPVVGSVSVRDNTVYCVAGRSSYLDGGMALCRLDLMTGRELGRTSFYSRDPETGEQPDALLEDVELPGTLPDILTFDGDNMFLRDKQFDLDGNELVAQYRPHLYSSGGLLDPNWWHRTIWIWGERAFGRASGWAIAGRYRPSGRLLTLDGPRLYGYKFSERGGKRKGGGKAASQHVLFCADKKVVKVDRKINNNNPAVTRHMTPDKIVTHWSRGLDFAVRAMVKADSRLFAAGPHAATEIAFADPGMKAVLASFEAGSGEPLPRLEIPSQPVFDGMAAASEQLYLSLLDGTVVCYGGKPGPGN